MEQRYIVLVSNSLKRDEVVKSLKENLIHTNECDKSISVVQPTLNKVEVYNISPPVPILIRSITVIVVPVIVNTDPLYYGLNGPVTIIANDVIKELYSKIQQLELINGPVTIKRGNNATTAAELDRSLQGIYAEHGAGSHIR
jgi:hypothetical protein